MIKSKNKNNSIDKLEYVEREVWKDIPGYDGVYQASNRGRIRSYYNNRWGKSDNYKILSPSDNGRGYSQLALITDGTAKSLKVHRLVAKTFIPNPEGKKYINHKNGDKKDNRVENLEWCTFQENMKHAYDSGLLEIPGLKGEECGASKLCKQDVIDIRNHAENNGRYYGRKQLAEKYDVSENNITCIVNRKTWRHVEP